MRIESVRKYRGRNPNGYFRDLPLRAQMRARQWLSYLLARRRKLGKSTPLWTFALLVGQAKRLTLNPPTSEWGRSMLAKKGGYAVQRKYQIEGGHPTAAATRARLIKHQLAKKKAAAKERRWKHGIFFDFPIFPVG
jgi:hypothetical protein